MEKNILPNLTNSQEPEQGVFGALEQKPEPLEKKTKSRSRLGKKSGVGADKKFAASPALVVYFQLETTLSGTMFHGTQIVNTVCIDASILYFQGWGLGSRIFF